MGLPRHLCPAIAGQRHIGRSPSWTAAAKLPPFMPSRLNFVARVAHTLPYIYATQAVAARPGVPLKQIQVETTPM